MSDSAVTNTIKNKREEESERQWTGRMVGREQQKMETVMMMKKESEDLFIKRWMLGSVCCEDEGRTEEESESDEDRKGGDEDEDN